MCSVPRAGSGHRTPLRRALTELDALCGLTGGVREARPRPDLAVFLVKTELEPLVSLAVIHTKLRPYFKFLLCLYFRLQEGEKSGVL